MSDFAKERSYDQNNCNRLTLLSASEDNELSRNQEKGYKKSLLHYLHALERYRKETVLFDDIPPT